MNNKVMRAINEYLEKKGLEETTPVDVSPFLEKKGILSDSKSRPGKPLRDLLRQGEIPNSFKRGGNWFIIHSSKSINHISVAKNEPSTASLKPEEHQHKLMPIVDALRNLLDETINISPSIILEYKSEWLKSYPSVELIKEYPVLKDIYSSLTDNRYDLSAKIEALPKKRQRQKQAFDIWIDAPLNVAIEFDEGQHFNQFRLTTLQHYNNIDTGYSLDYYLELNSNITKEPGSSGFVKLKSTDPLFPSFHEGNKQDNRIRQRAFRDTLKDIMPISQGFNPTIRIPYHIVSKKRKEFSQDDINHIMVYLSKFLPVS